MTATGSATSRDFVLSWPPVCSAQGSPAGLGGGWPILTVGATHTPPAHRSDIVQETAASLARSRSSRTTLY
jgi:hypothetical protein